MRALKCGPKGFGTSQVRLDDFVGEFAILGRIAGQSAYLELIGGLKGANYGASLLSGCADSTAVDRLVERGLVSRVESPDDRRVRVVSLTPKGKD
jgi:Winged helix DNA-binding domain